MGGWPAGSPGAPRRPSRRSAERPPQGRPSRPGHLRGPPAGPLAHPGHPHRGPLRVHSGRPRPDPGPTTTLPVLTTAGFRSADLNHPVRPHPGLPTGTDPGPGPATGTGRGLAAGTGRGPALNTRRGSALATGRELSRAIGHGSPHTLNTGHGHPLTIGHGPSRATERGLPLTIGRSLSCAVGLAFLLTVRLAFLLTGGFGSCDGGGWCRLGRPGRKGRNGSLYSRSGGRSRTWFDQRRRLQRQPLGASRVRARDGHGDRSRGVASSSGSRTAGPALRAPPSLRHLHGSAGGHAVRPRAPRPDHARLTAQRDRRSPAEPPVRHPGRPRPRRPRLARGHRRPHTHIPGASGRHSHVAPGGHAYGAADEHAHGAADGRSHRPADQIHPPLPADHNHAGDPDGGPDRVLDRDSP